MANSALNCFTTYFQTATLPPNDKIMSWLEDSQLDPVHLEPIDLTSRGESAYNMSHKHRGIFMIINNRKFHPQTHLSDRKGSEIDAAKLSK